MAESLNLEIIKPNIIEVVYALPKYQHIFTVDIVDFDNKHQVTILDIIKKSGILEYYPDINLEINKVGIYGELKELSDHVEEYDRVEIYRPLKIDPMAARRLRAARQKDKV